MTESVYAGKDRRPPIAILGVPFDNVTTSETLARIGEMIHSRRPHYLVTANVDFVVQARSDLELRRILVDAHLVVADGMPLVWASRWLGNPLPERVTGSGMTPLLLQEAEARGWRVFFLGGSEQSVAQAAANTRAKHPRLHLVGAYSPPFKPLVEMDHADILRRLREARPDILLVAFGCPKQEKWLNMHYRAAGVPVAIGVGATIDFLAGTMKRAPLWMQRTGCEWIFRLLQEPRRLFRRYVTDLWVFGWAILRQVGQLPARKKSGDAPFSAAADPTADPAALLVRLPRRFTVQTVREQDRFWDRLPERSCDLLLDATALEVIDSAGMAVLARLQSALRERSRSLVLVSASSMLTRALTLMGLSPFFARSPNVLAALHTLAARRQESSVVMPPDKPDAPLALVWQGEIIAANIEAVADSTEKALARASGRLVIDLSAVRFMDSSGLGLLVRLRRLAQAQNKDLAFSGPTESVRGIARLAKLEDYLFGSAP